MAKIYSRIIKKTHFKMYKQAENLTELYLNLANINSDDNCHSNQSRKA
jgi:hypothetical protein